MVYSTSTIALGALLLQTVNVMSTPLALLPKPVESARPDSVGPFGSAWSTSPIRGPPQPPISPWSLQSTELASQLPTFMHLKTRADIASDVAYLARLLNTRSRDVEMLDARGFGGALEKIFSKLGPLLLRRRQEDGDIAEFAAFLNSREEDDDTMAQLERLLQSREFGDDLEARGLFGFLPKIISIISKGRNAVDTVLPTTTPPSPPAPATSNAPAPQRRSNDPDIQALSRLFSRDSVDDERQSGIHRKLFSSSLLPVMGSFPLSINDHSLVYNRPLQVPETPAPSLAPQRRAVEDDIEELERLLGREMTDVERRGLGTKLGQVAPFAPLLFQGFDWIKDHIGNQDSPAQPSESAAPQ